MTSIHITKVMIKEHLFILSIDKKMHHIKLKVIMPGVKVAFMRKYNKFNLETVKKMRYLKMIQRATNMTKTTS